MFGELLEHSIVGSDETCFQELGRMELYVSSLLQIRENMKIKQWTHVIPLLYTKLAVAQVTLGQLHSCVLARSAEPDTVTSVFWRMGQWQV
jgi:hypothetical protein